MAKPRYVKWVWNIFVVLVIVGVMVFGATNTRIIWSDSSRQAEPTERIQRRASSFAEASRLFGRNKEFGVVLRGISPYEFYSASFLRGGSFVRFADWRHTIKVGSGNETVYRFKVSRTGWTHFSNDSNILWATRAHAGAITAWTAIARNFETSPSDLRSTDLGASPK